MIPCKAIPIIEINIFSLVCVCIVYECYNIHLNVFIIRIQAIDGGFFEKFGSLLRQRSERAEELELESAHLVTDSSSLRTIEEAENDSGTETLHDTDSEPEDQQSKQEELIQDCTGLNVSLDAIEIAVNKKQKRNSRAKNKQTKIGKGFDFLCCYFKQSHIVKIKSSS